MPFSGITDTRGPQESEYRSTQGEKNTVARLPAWDTVEHLEKEYWLPMISDNWRKANQFISCINGEHEPELYRVRNGCGGWEVMSSNQNVPQFVQLKAGRVITHHYKVLVTMPHRRFDCLICGHNTHWYSNCPGRQRQRQSEQCFFQLCLGEGCVHPLRMCPPRPFSQKKPIVKK